MGEKQNRPFQLSFNASLKIELVVDEPAAAFGEDGGPIGQARPVSLAAVGREPSHTAAVWKDSASNRYAGSGDWVAGGQ